jgi:hypothetical protein
MSVIAQPSSQTGADVLAKAIEKIRHQGWCQRAMFEGDWVGGRYVERSCIGGAIYRACKHTGSYTEAMSALQRAIGTGNVNQWNDAPERTKADVVGALRAALAELSVHNQRKPQ